MCFELRDAALAAACKERDDLKKRLAAATEVWSGIKEDMEAEILRLTNIAEHQANMNQNACLLALQLDTVTADRNRLQEAYDAMSRDLSIMSARLTEAQNELAEMVKKASEKCETCAHYNNSIGDMVCHTCHGKNRWELVVK